MVLSRISSIIRLSPQLRSRIMSAGTEAELIRLGESLHLGNGDNTQLINLLNSRMNEIRGVAQSVPQLRERISAATSLQEMNQLLVGIRFSPEEASSLLGIINRKRAEFLGSVEKLSHPAVANLERIHMTMGQIFERPYTLEEANEAARAYKDAFAQTEITSFMTKMYRQLLKDYRFGISDIPAQSADCDGAFASFGIIKGLEIDHSAIFRDNVNKSHVFKCFVHELKHALQHKIECGTDFAEYIRAEVENNFRNIDISPMAQRILRQNCGNKQLAMEQMELELKELILPFLKNTESIQQSSPLYSRGLALIDNTRNYKHYSKVPYAEYKGQKIEEEAFRAGDLAEELYNLLRC